MNLELIVEVAKYLIIALSILATVYGSMNGHAKKKLNMILQIREVTKKFVQEAEQIENYKGHAKKNYVMTAVTQYLMSKGIKVDYDMIDKEIETTVELSKNVNKRPERNPAMQEQGNSHLRVK